MATRDTVGESYNVEKMKVLKNNDFVSVKQAKLKSYWD